MMWFSIDIGNLRLRWAFACHPWARAPPTPTPMQTSVHGLQDTQKRRRSFPFSRHSPPRAAASSRAWFDIAQRPSSTAVHARPHRLSRRSRENVPDAPDDAAAETHPAAGRRAPACSFPARSWDFAGIGLLHHLRLDLFCNASYCPAGFRQAAEPFRTLQGDRTATRIFARHTSPFPKSLCAFRDRGGSPTARRAGHHQHGHGPPGTLLPAPHINEAVKKAVDDGQVHYTSNYGLLELRQEVARKLKGENGLGYAPETEIVITAGVSEALHLKHGRPAQSRRRGARHPPPRF